MSVTAKETQYFYEKEGLLYQAIDLIFGIQEVSSAMQVSICAGNCCNYYEYSALPGSRNLRVIAPVDMSRGIREVEISFKGTIDIESIKVPIGSFKPWTIYVAQDKHLDYGWKHKVDDVVMRINSLTDYHIDLHEEKESKFNFDTTLWFDEFRKARPESRVNKFVELLKNGNFEMGAFYAVLANGILTEEEFIQCMMPARRIERDYEVKFTTAVPTEVPSMNWGMATILAGAGIGHISRGSYELSNINIFNREPYPLFFWEGPDGSRILVKFDLLELHNTYDRDCEVHGSYAEALKLRRGTYDDRIRYIERGILRYQAYENYPFDALMLMGTGWDEYPFDSEALDFINWFNKQGWSYPKLVDCIYSDFWKHIEREIGKGVKVPVLKGDFGSSWEEWPAQLAYINALYRKARGIVQTAQVASAAAAMLTRKYSASREEELYDCYLNLVKFADHNIGGITLAEFHDIRDRKTTYVYTALKKGNECLEISLAEIAESIHNDRTAILAFNPLSFRRSGAIRVVMPEFKNYSVTDADTGMPVKSHVQTMGVHPENYLTIIATDVPAYGYKVYHIEALPESGRPDKVESELCDGVLENEFCRLEVDRVTGGISSLYDKRQRRELVDQKAPYKVNQFLYTSSNQVYSVNGVKVSRGHEGEASRSIVVEGATFRHKIRTTYTMFENLEHIEIANELGKEPSTELQTCHFVYPFNIPGREYHYDSAACILKPGLAKDGGNQLPGAGMGTFCGLHFADASNAEYGITLSSIDSHLYHFGSNTMDRSEGYIDPLNSTIYSLVIENYNRNDFALNQGGQDAFTFRYGILPHVGGFKASDSLKFAKGLSYPLVARLVRKKDTGELEPKSASFVTIAAENVISAGLKVSEDGLGTILRLRECEGRKTLVGVTSQIARIVAAISTDLLEREKFPLKVENCMVYVEVPAHGLVSVKLIMDSL